MMVKERGSLVLLAALALTACTTASGDRQEVPAPQGVHLLADAEIVMTLSEPGRLQARFEGNVVNGGSVPCSDIYFHMNWPLELKLINEESWSDGNAPHKMGDRFRPFGKATFELAGLNRDQTAERMTGARLVLTCHDPERYERAVIPLVRYE